MEGYALPPQTSANAGPPGFLPEWRSKAPSRLRSSSQEDVLNMVGRLELGPHDADHHPAGSGACLCLAHACMQAAACTAAKQLGSVSFAGLRKRAAV